MHISETESKRITVNLPAKLLAEAQECTGKNMTETLIEGLSYLKRGRAYEKAMRLKGKLILDINLDESRERRR